VTLQDNGEIWSHKAGGHLYVKLKMFATIEKKNVLSCGGNNLTEIL
jgi:hypothetical protein